MFEAARSDPPMPRARAAARAAQQREQERAARKKERKIQRRERRERQSEEYRLREQQGLSPLANPEYSSSSSEKEESDGGRAPSRVGCSHPHRQEPQRWQRSRRPWRALMHPPRGSLLEEWCARRKRRRVPRRHLGVLLRRHVPPQRPPNPRGRGSAVSPP
jgi:hypothetical protein